MKIMFVTSSMNYGGAERVMSLLANEFIKRDYSVTLTVLDDNKIIAYKLDEKVNVKFMQSARFNKIGNFKKLISTLKTIIIESEPEIIISFFNSTFSFVWLASRGMKIPLIFSERNDPYNNIVGIKAKIFQQIALRVSDHIVFQTYGARNYYGKSVVKKSSVIINPFNETNLPKYYTGVRKKTIVSVGRLNKQKNQKLLIEAFSEIYEKFSEYKLVIYGEGNLRDELESIIRAKQLKNHVLLPGTNNDILKEINSASVFVLSSDYEGLPNALIEAMAVGLPCISTDCSPGGARELIKDKENGLLVPCGDIKSMANALIYMLEHEEERNRMGKNAIKVISKMNINKVTDSWIYMLNKMRK